MTKFALKLIEIYQHYLSPDHSEWGTPRFPNGYCQYYPSCSEYAKQAIIKNGLFKGFLQGIYRIIKCNPLSRGGFDPVRNLMPKASAGAQANRISNGVDPVK